MTNAKTGRVIMAIVDRHSELVREIARAMSLNFKEVPLVRRPGVVDFHFQGISANERGELLSRVPLEAYADRATIGGNPLPDTTSIE